MSASLQLRRKKDGKLYLERGTQAPKDHWLTERFVMDRMLAGEISVKGDALTLHLENGDIHYKVTKREPAYGPEATCGFEAHWHLKLVTKGGDK